MVVENFICFWNRVENTEALQRNPEQVQKQPIRGAK